MTIDEFMRIIGTVGFPIAVAAWLLWKILPAMEKLTESNHAVAAALERVHDVIDKCQGPGNDSPN